MTPAKLRLVEPTDQPAPATDYEWQQRQHAASKRWDRLHIEADRREGFAVVSAARRLWRR